MKKRGSPINLDIHHSIVFSSDCILYYRYSKTYQDRKLLTNSFLSVELIHLRWVFWVSLKIKTTIPLRKELSVLLFFTPLLRIYIWIFDSNCIIGLDKFLNIPRAEMIKLWMTSENFIPEISLGRQGILKLDSVLRKKRTIGCKFRPAL